MSARSLANVPRTLPDIQRQDYRCMRLKSTLIRRQKISLPCIRSGVSKYLVQWDKETNFGRSQAGGEVSHADAAQWSEVVADTQYQV